MIVVADSSAFVVLIAIGYADVLPALFHEIVIPPQVAAELASPKRSEAVRAFIAAPPSWLRIVDPKFVEGIKGLHTGEGAAISLARELGADRIIIDEVSGRKAASARGLSVVGTIGVLEAAAGRKLIDLSDAFAKVKDTDFWVSHPFLDARLVLFRERNR